MRFSHLDLAVPVATLTLDHSGGNRINFAMRGELLAAFEEVAASQARVLVVRGQGADFCLGGDIREWPGLAVAELRPRIEVFAKALATLKRLSIPTIAAVQGGCQGGGFELALSCDFILAGRTARFGFPEARLGIMTLQGGVLQLAERIGGAKALEVVLFSEAVAAEQWADWNVVNRVVDDEDLQAVATRWANGLASRSLGVHAATKELLRIWNEAGPRGAEEALYDLSMPLFEKAEVQQCLRAAVGALQTGPLGSGPDVAGKV